MKPLKLGRLVMTGAVVASILGAAVPVAGFASPASTGVSLTKYDRELLSEARAAGNSKVTMLIATQPGATKSVADAIAALGGAVRFRDDTLSYVRARVSVDSVDAVARISGVQTANLDEIIPLDEPAPEASDDSVTVDPPGPGTPSQNAYMPTRDTGAPQFVAANPTFDGRGVKVGIVDTGIDLLTPELQTAKNLDGSPTRKLVDWVTYTDPEDDNDPTWINMADQVTAVGGTFTYNGATYSAPADGTYRVGVFNERDVRFGGELGNDINRDGNPAGSSGLFAVLWDPASNNVYVDTNQNGSFADQAAMTDYKVRYDVGVFGTDNPATAVRETIPFVVQTDGARKFVNIGVVSGQHGTHVAGITAGKGFFNGAFNGAAPEAQIASVRACLFIAGCTSHALIEGMIYVEKQSNVDVTNMSIGGLPALNDGNNTRATIYNRLIDQYKAQMFISAGNSGPGLNTVGDPSVATKVMSVGAYVHRDTWLNNYGAVAAKVDGLFVFSSRGPREDGGFKPNIVAPGSAISSTPAWQPGGPVAGTYALPPGYSMLNGTSMAAPQATGGAALLISAAKQSNVQYKPEQLREAMNSSARYLPAYGAYQQGNGLLQIGAAWNLLRTNIKTVDISSQAPVRTILSQYLATPHQGPGIYEREGWTAGQTGQRTITFTRSTGGSRNVNYNLTWVGNDGTFSSASSISLGLNTPAGLNVNISPAGPGAHSALLYLDDPSSPGIEYQVLNTVVVANQFNASNNYTVSNSGSADRPDFTTFFYYVPANTPAFKVDLTGVSGRVRMLRQHPYGVPLDSTTSTPYQTGGSQSRTLSNPIAGVWEVTVDTSRTSSVSPATFTITASILGVDVDPTTWTIDPATIGTVYNQNFTFTNRFGTFTGNAVGTALGSAYSARPTIANHTQQTYTVNIPAGSTSLSVRIGSPSDTGADLDLFVKNPSGAIVAQSAGGSAEENVTVANPVAGAWTVLIDGYSVPSGSTAYNYLDVFANSAFGSVSVTDAAAVHANGSSWTAPASVVANAAPAAGRYLQGFVRVVSGASVLGSAEVQLKNVAP